MKWSEFLKIKKDIPTGYQQTDIECPKCGELVLKRTDVVLACYPPKHEYRCHKCGWSEFA